MHISYKNKLKKLELIEFKEPKKVQFRTEESKDWDLAQLVASKHFYKHFVSATQQDKVFFKTIVVNNAQALCPGNLDKSLYKFLFKIGFILCVRIADKTYVTVKDFKNLTQALKKISLVSDEDKIRSEIQGLHKELKNYIILNDELRRQILVEFQYELSNSNNSEDLYFVEKLDTFCLKLNHNFSSENIAALTKLISNHYKFIKYVLPFDLDNDFHISETFKFKFVWENQFTQTQLITLIHQLKDGFITDAISNDNFYSIDIFNVGHEKLDGIINIALDVKPFIKAKHLNIAWLTIKNLVYLKNIEKIALHYLTVLEEIDLTNFPHLKLIQTFGSTVPIKKIPGKSHDAKYNGEVIFSDDVENNKIIFKNAKLFHIELYKDNFPKDKNLELHFKFDHNLSEFFTTFLSQPNFPINDFSQLEEFILKEFDIETIDVSPLKNLKDLSLQTDSIKQIKGLNQCKQLNKLDVCLKHMNLEKELNQIQTLKKLCLSHSSINVIPIIPVSIESLTIKFSKALVHLDLSHLKNLKELTLKELSHLQEVILPANLKKLNLHNCPCLKKITFSSHIESFSIYNCKQLDISIDISTSIFVEVNNSPQVKLINHKTNSLLKELTIQSQPNDYVIDLSGLHQLHKVSIHSIASQMITIINDSQVYHLKDINVFNLDTFIEAFPLTIVKDANTFPEYTADYDCDDSEKINNEDQLLDFLIPNESNTSSHSHIPTLSFDELSPNTLPEVTAQKIFDCDISTTLYRINVYPNLAFSSDGTIYLPKKPTTLTYFNPLKLPKEIPADAIQGRQKVFLSQDKELTLIGFTPHDQLCSLSNLDKFNIFFNDKNQWVIQLKPDISHYHGVIAYHIKPDWTSYIARNQKVDLNVDFDRSIDMPNDKKVFLFGVIQEINKRALQDITIKAKVFKDDVSASQRLNEIVSFCRDFSLKGNITLQNKLHKLMLLIINKNGSCNERSYVAKLLCDYYQIPARIDNNDSHQYIEVITAIGKVVAIDLGGSPATVIEKPIPQMKTRKPKPDLVTLAKETTSKEEENDLSNNEILANVQWVKTATSFKDFANQLLLKEKRQLMRTDNATQEYQSYQAWQQYAKEKHYDFIYIHNASDLKQYLKPLKIENFQPIDGSLQQLITKQSHGVVLINWSGFTAEERLVYKGLLERPAKLHGQELSPNIKIVPMLRKDIQVNDVFLRRATSIPTPTDVLPTLATANHSSKQLNAPIKQVQLYHSEDWTQRLIHTIKLKDSKAQVTKGPLIIAMEKGLPIEIINPPKEDDEFEILRKRLQIEGKILWNGEIVCAQDGFSLSIKDEPIQIISPTGIMIIKDKPPITDGKKYFINRTTFNYLFNTNQISPTENPENDAVNTIDGILASLKPNDQIILTTEFDTAEIAMLYDYLVNLSETQRNNIHIYQPTFDQDIAMDLGNVSELNVQKSKHIESQDPHFVAKFLQRANGIKSQNIFYATGENTWAEFIETNHLKIENQTLLAKRKPSLLWEKLCKGETVILIGDLSIEDQENIDTLFAVPPYLFVNGERVEAQGKLIWCSKPQCAHTPLSKANETFTPTLKDYENLLEKEIGAKVIASEDRANKTIKKQRTLNLDAKIVSDINNFFFYANKMTSTVHAPHPEHFTYEKYSRIYHKLVAYKNAQIKMYPAEFANPIKPIVTYHYEKNSEAYAYMNVISKMLFARRDNETIRYHALNQIKTDQTFDQHIWRILNCFSGEYIRRNFNISFDDITEGAIPQLNELITEKIKNHIQSLDLNQPAHYRIERELKQQRRVLNALMTEHQPLVMLLGEAGIGKTFNVRKLKQKGVNVFEGFAEIPQWLSKTDASYQVLLLDEANLLPKQRLEFSRGLTQQPPVLNYLGVSHPLTPYQKVFLTGNPLSYVGREFHEVLWDCAHLIWFGSFEKAFIQQFVMHSLQDKCDDKNASLVSNLIAQFYLDMTSLTLRDIENITEKLMLYKTINKYKTWEECAKQAIYAEVQGLLANKEERAQLRDKLQITLLSYESLTINEMVIPEEKMDIWHLLNDDLMLRNHALHRTDASPFKRGVLLEGASGIGKSSMMKNALQKQGFSLHAEDPQKKYYHLTAREDNVRETLQTAAKEGSIVILDELNYDPELEDLLNQLLDPNNEKVKLGFMVLATQNPTHYENCKKLAKGFENRFHRIVMETFERHELEFIAKIKGHKNPKKITNDFFIAKQQFPSLTPADLFDCLNVQKM